jgi:hypothetical protein
MASGGVPEWFKGPVLKTVVAQVTVGSNPTPSATSAAATEAQLAARCPSTAASKTYPRLRTVVMRQG